MTQSTIKKGLLVKPNDFLGIIGGGQLGRMLAMEAKRLGIKTAIFSEISDCPAIAIADKAIIGSYQDAHLLDEFSRLCPVITYEFENVPLSIADYLGMRTQLRPGRDILSITQDRLAEKTFLGALSIPTADFGAVAYEGDIKILMDRNKKPAILKTRTQGYDGKGQAIIDNSKMANMAYYDIKEVPAIIEEKIDFKSEFSVIAVRSVDGEFLSYSPTDNIHKNGILIKSIAPSRLSSAILEQGKNYTRKIADALGYIGVLAVEFFVTQDDKVFANEIAPRVHNSGHWTLDGCHISQFEQHIRAICGWKLATVEHHSTSIMTNLIGYDIDNWETYSANPNTKIHLYGKTETREDRKMGHVTELFPKG